MKNDIIIKKLDLILNNIQIIENDISQIKSYINDNRNMKENTITNEIVKDKPIISELNLSPNLINMFTSEKIKPKKTNKTSISTKKPTNSFFVSKSIDENLKTLLNLNEKTQSRESLKQKIIALSTIYGTTITIPSNISNELELDSSTMSIVEFEKLMNKIFE